MYRAQQGNEELIGWAFPAMLREQFDYHRYPLGRHQIWIQLWHIDFERNVYLLPDLGAYTSLVPATLPGVDSDLVLENWEIQQSFFSYRAKHYNADFGIQGYVADQLQPELSYNISIKRHLLSALVSRLIVPIVILIQLFVIVIVIGRDSERLEKFGVRPGAVVFTCGHSSLPSLWRKIRYAPNCKRRASSISKVCTSSHISSSSLSLSIRYCWLRSRTSDCFANMTTFGPKLCTGPRFY